MSNCKVYLGDSVYADFDGFTIIIYIDNGIEESRHIALDLEVMTALISYKERMYDSERRENNSNNNKPS